MIGLGLEKGRNEKAAFMLQSINTPISQVARNHGISENSEFLGFEVQHVLAFTNYSWNDPKVEGIHKTFKKAFIQWLNTTEDDNELVEIAYIFREPGADDNDLTPVWLKSYEQEGEASDIR